jgi:hypothetical protein
VQVEEEKDEQLASLSAELLKLHSSLLVERKRILFILQAVPTQLLRVYKSVEITTYSGFWIFPYQEVSDHFN